MVHNLPRGCGILLYWCLRTHVGEGVPSRSHHESDKSAWISISTLSLGVPMNCGGERSVRTITLLLHYCYRNHFNSLFDWPLLGALLTALLQEREVSVQEGGNMYGKISFYCRGARLYAGHRPRQMATF